MGFGTNIAHADTGDWRARDRARVDDALQLLEDRSPAATRLLGQLAASGTRISVLPDAEFYADRPYNTGAIYDYARNEIQMPRSRVHADPVRAAVMLAHEAQHHADQQNPVREAVLRAAGGVVGAIAAVAHLDSPVSGFNTAVRARRDGHEVSAYHLQAAVARELGRPELGSLGARGDGTPKSEAEVREALSQSAIYRDDRRRAALSARRPGERPPSDPAGSFDGDASVFTLDPSLAPRHWAGPPWHAGWQGGAAGAALGAGLVLGTPLRRVLPAAVTAAVVGATALGGFTSDRLRQS